MGAIVFEVGAIVFGVGANIIDVSAVFLGACAIIIDRWGNLADNICECYFEGWGAIMIKSLTISNFKAFATPVTLDFGATGKYNFSMDALQDNIVKTAIMYGRNASGKSSLALAIFDIVINLTDNYTNSSKYDVYQNAFDLGGAVTFEYKFLLLEQEVVYRYKKQNFNSIISETLIIGGDTVVNYDKSISDEVTVKLEGAQSLQVSIAKLDISLLKFIKNNSVLDTKKDDTNKIFLELFEFVDRMLLFWSLDSRGFVGYLQVPSGNVDDRIIKEGHFDGLVEFFRAAGFTDELFYAEMHGRYTLFVKINGKSFDFWEIASTGMKSLLLVYYWIEDLKENKDIAPSFICIDEFDAFYHFELARFVVEQLKKTSAQVLLTTHNTTLLTNEILRPDCFFICTKDKIVNLNNATPKELREGHNLERLYRGGTFGK